jgi:endonuclease/exonuclease/phosphatase (EEP) superfamily protein YafD
MPLSSSNRFTNLFNNGIAYLFLLLTVIVTLLSLAGYLGELNMYLEVITNFRHQYLLLGLIFFFFFLLTRHRVGLIVSLLCLSLNLVEIVPWYIPEIRASNSNSGQTMRLFLFNVLHQNTRYADAISLVNKEKPTVAAFLEATPPWPDELAVLQKTLPYHFSAKKLQIEIYSSLPLKNTSIKRYGNYRGLVVSNLTVGAKEITFIATHAYPQLYFGKEGFEWRNQQLEGIGDYFRQIQKPVVLIGDLNVTVWSPSYKSTIQRSGLHNARAGFGILPTLSALSPQTPWLAVPVDHCLVSPDIRVLDFRTGPAIGSDHLPIIADVVLPAS